MARFFYNNPLWSLSCLPINVFSGAQFLFGFPFIFYLWGNALFSCNKL
jgi:hypothetical protein